MVTEGFYVAVMLVSGLKSIISKFVSINNCFKFKETFVSMCVSHLVLMLRFGNVEVHLKRKQFVTVFIGI